MVEWRPKLRTNVACGAVWRIHSEDKARPLIHAIVSSANHADTGQELRFTFTSIIRTRRKREPWLRNGPHDGA